MDNKKYYNYGPKCQDDLIKQKFVVLHKQIVNTIIQFCKENNINVNEFYLKADGLGNSIKYGSWQPSTDSCFELYENDIRYDTKPYLSSL